MDSNAFLLSFGMKPGDFDRAERPVESDDGFSMRHGRHRHGGPKMGGWSFKESEEGIAKTILFCTQGEEDRGYPSPGFQKNSQFDLNPEGDSTIKKF